MTAEGFKKLAVRKLVHDPRPPDFAELVPLADDLGKLLKKHEDALREFRNSVLPLLDDPNGIKRFFNDQPNRLKWEEELQEAITRFFSNSRILCQVHYALHNRKKELFK